MKNSYKLAIASVIFFIPMLTAYAMMPSERENQFIQLGNIEGQQLQLHKAAEQERIDSAQRLLDYSTQWQTMESERIALRESLFPAE